MRPQKKRRSPYARRLGDLIREGRKERGLGQVQLAERIGVAQSTVSAYELGFQEPDLAKLVRLADELGFSLDELRSVA